MTRISAIVAACCAALPLSAQIQGQAPKPLPVRSVSLLRTVGNDDNQTTLGRVQNLAVGVNGLLYILDSSDFDVKVFDVEGKFIRKFGRRGAGPGEFQRPIAFRMTDSSVTVVDQANGYVEFSLDGRFIVTRGPGTTPLKGTEMRYGYRLLVSPPLGGSLMIMPRQPTPPEPYLFSVEIRGPKRADTIATYVSEILRRRVNDRPMFVNAGFGNWGAAAPLGDSVVVVADGLAGTLKLFSIEVTGPKLRRTENLGQAQQPVTVADLNAAEARITASTAYISTTASTGSIAPPPSPQSIGKIENPPKFWSMASRIFTSPSGDIWIGAPRDLSSGLGAKRIRTIENNTWSVFPANGTRFRVTLPATETFYGVHGDYVFTMPVAQEDPGIRVYRVNR